MKNLAELSHQLTTHPDQIRQLFYLSQILVGVVFLMLFFFILNRRPESQIKKPPEDPNEQNEKKPLPTINLPPPQKSQPKKQLLLEGFNLHGKPHEILGVPLNASSEEIQKAYRNLMKHYHPDRVARPGTYQWKEAQKIAEAINQAKEKLLPKNSS